MQSDLISHAGSSSNVDSKTRGSKLAAGEVRNHSCNRASGSVVSKVPSKERPLPEIAAPNESQREV